MSGSGYQARVGNQLGSHPRVRSWRRFRDWSGLYLVQASEFASGQGWGQGQGWVRHTFSVAQAV